MTYYFLNLAENLLRKMKSKSRKCLEKILPSLQDDNIWIVLLSCWEYAIHLLFTLLRSTTVRTQDAKDGKQAVYN